MSLLFGRILLPKAVRVELNRRRSTKDRLKRLRNDYGAFLVPCDDYDHGAVDILLVDRNRSDKKDRRETEAVVQAAGKGAMVIMDDRQGRKLAERYSLPCHGTLWILDQLHQLDLLTPLTLRQNLERLRERKIRFPLEAANQLLERYGEEQL